MDAEAAKPGPAPGGKSHGGALPEAGATLPECATCSVRINEK